MGEETDTSWDKEIIVYYQLTENSTNFLISSSNKKEKEEIEENVTNPTNFLLKTKFHLYILKIQLNIQQPLELLIHIQILTFKTNMNKLKSMISAEWMIRVLS